MKLKQNYLYRVVPGLETEKKIRKDDRGWHPASSRSSRATKAVTVGALSSGWISV